jgi:hypothetical protein
MHGADIENAQPSWGGKVIRWLRALVIDERWARLWLGLALRGDISRVGVGGLGGGVGIWPELRVVWRRRERGGIRMPIVRMIGTVFVVVGLQKVVGVHDERELKEGKGYETRVGRADFRPRGTEGEKVESGRVALLYCMCYALYVSTTIPRCFSLLFSCSPTLPLSHTHPHTPLYWQPVTPYYTDSFSMDC